jgi:hypothetical protein
MSQVIDTHLSVELFCIWIATQSLHPQPCDPSPNDPYSSFQEGHTKLIKHSWREALRDEALKEVETYDEEKHRCRPHLSVVPHTAP